MILSEKKMTELLINKLANPNANGIAARTGWYQEVEIAGVKTANNSLANEASWKRIKSLLPFSLFKTRVLDIGCNAGLFSINASLDGAEVIGVERDIAWLEQACLLQLFKGGKAKFALMDVTVDNLKVLGHFDYTLLIGVAAEIMLARGERKFSPKSQVAQKSLIKTLTEMSGSVVVRSREKQPGMSKAFYTEAFKECGWREINSIEDGNADLLLTRYIA